MLVFWEQRLVFLATPKAGSTAVAMALESLAALSIQRPPVLKHTTAQRYHRFLGPYLRAASGHDFETVALMREPIDWLGSWYRFRQRDDVMDERLSTRDMSFDAFARAYAATPQPGFANVGAQSRFLTPEGKPPVDRIFRYEEIAKFVDFLEQRLDCEIILPRVNVSPAADTALSADTRDLLKVAMALDFALYDRLE